MLIATVLCIMGFIIVATIFWLWMLVDCIMSRRLPDGQKAIWILVMLFTHVIGALLYMFLVRKSQPAQNYVQPQARPASRTSYTSYQQGYQAAQPAPSPYQPGVVSPPPVVPYEQQPSHDYEQPQAMYPHEQNNNE